MTPRVLRAPGNDGGLLAEPPFGSVSGVMAANRSFLEAWNHDFQGRTAIQLRGRCAARHWLWRPPFSGTMAWTCRTFLSEPQASRPRRWWSPGISPSCSTPASGSRTSRRRGSPRRTGEPRST